MNNKTPFPGDLEEKAYLLGLRTGDIHARKHYILVQAETTSTKKSQLKMFKEAFLKYADVKSYQKKGGYTEKTNKIYTFLDSSFSFIVKKPTSIPSWIIDNSKYFYPFLAGYCDSEASWILTQHKKYDGKWKDIIFSLGTCDKTILEQINQKLMELGFNSHLYLVRKKGTYGSRICNLDLYRVMLINHKDVVKLAKTLLPLSRHDDKKKAKKRIINYNEMNQKRKMLKREKMGTVKKSCIKCNHKKVWKNGYSKYKDKKYIRYKCPICKHEFQRGFICLL